MKTRISGIVFIIVGLLIILHHIVISGRLFDIQDILHHEFFEAIFLTAGITMLITIHNN
jgi:hypothetical protein